MEQWPIHFGGTFDDGGMMNNLRFRPGEVQAVYTKDDPQNVSRKFVEYKVLVQHRSNGVVINRMYDHVFAVDTFGGIADYANWTFRADPSGNRLDGKKEPGAGVGSKVLILCVNGESHNACIVGGIRDSNGLVDDPEEGHRLRFRFNGIAISINKDGEMTLEYQGAMLADGTVGPDVDTNAVGTTVKITKDGNFTVADKDSKNKIVLDHAQGKVFIESENEIVETAPKIRHGSVDSDEPHVLGNKTNDWVKQLINAIKAISVPTGTGPSGPPINSPLFEQLGQQFQDNLSERAFTEK